jgi:methionine-rich copper-binding protein CopC
VSLKIRLSLFALAGVLLATATTPAGARFHTRLTKSNPAADTTLSASPRAIELWWNEKPDASLTTVIVQGADSAKAELGKLRVSENLMGVAADVTRPLMPGKYVVKWKTAGKDGHAVRGWFNFSISK